MGERERVSGGLQGPAWERSESGGVGTAMGRTVMPAWRDPRWGRLGLSLEGPQVRGDLWKALAVLDSVQRAFGCVFILEAGKGG